MRKSTIFSSGFVGRQIFKMVGLGIAGVFSMSVANAQLVGSYTINSGNPTGSGNFNSFAAFTTALSAAGNAISGPVTVTVVNGSGPYNEQLIMPAISGAGPGPGGTRIGITFIGNGQTLHYSGTSTTNSATVELNGTDYVTFQNLVIMRSGSGSYKWGVRLYNAANNVRFDGCTINVGAYSSTSNHTGILASSSNTSQSSGTGCFSNLEVWNSTIDGGYYAFYSYASSTTPNNGISFLNTNIKDTYYYGMYMYYNRNIVITGCKWEKPTQSYKYGYPIMAYYNNNITFTKNILKSFSYQAAWYYCNSTAPIAGDQILIANNMYCQNDHINTYAYGIFVGYSQNVKAYYNSVNMDGMSSNYTYAYAMYVYSCTNIDFRNNAMRSNTSSYTYYYFYNPAGTIVYNYNTFFQAISNAAWYMYYGTTNYSSLAALQSGTGTNANSQIADPVFVSKQDLHTTGANMYQKGNPVVGITDDYDGTLRPASLPSHGAHEFAPPANDAGAVVFTQPVAQCADTNDMIVTIKNYGTNSLDSVRVYWSWSGNTGSGSGVKNVAFQPALATGATASVDLTDVLMTSGAPGYNFRAYTSKPNGVTDQQAKNDTVDFYTQTAMEGSFTIGGTSPDFANFTAAVNGLNTYGVCGPIVFFARAGTYNERVAIKNLLGTSAVNTVVFTTDSNNTAPVLITYASSSTTNEGTFALDGASYITIDGYDIENTGGNYGDGVYIWNKCSNITISNNIIHNNTTSSTCRPVYIYTYGYDAPNIWVLNNTLSGGYYGAYVYGYNGSGPGLDNFRFEYNDISNSYYYGAYMYYFKNSKIIGNNVDMVGGNSYPNYAYGLMLYGYGSNYIISDNRIHAAYYGIYIYSMSGTSQNYSLFTNNKIMIGDTATAATIGYYALYFYSSGFFKIAHNLILSQTINGYTAYLNGGLNHMYNNIFGRVNSGTIMEINGAFTVTEADNNAYLAENGASAATGLAKMQGLGYDANGVAVAHLFDSLDMPYLETCNDTLVGAGVPLSYVTTDIDGGSRSAIAPTIGPHEYISPGGFTLGDDMKLCDGDTITLGANLAGASFLWSTSDTTGTIDVTTTGDYSVAVTTSCGQGNDTISITDASSQAAFASDRSWLTISFANNSINGVSYLWDFGDGSTSTDMNPTHLYATNGTYNVCLTTFGECDDNTDCEDVLAHNTVGLGEINGKNVIAVYPNPASDVLTVEAIGVEGNVMNIEISNISGQLMMTSRLNDFNGSAKELLDISSLTKGVYFVKIFTSEVTTTKRLVVQK